MPSNALQPKETRTEVLPAEVPQSVFFTPRVDIIENDQELLLEADMPGVKVDDLDIKFENGELTLHGKCAERHPGVNFLMEEYGIGDFYRSFAISQDIDADKITADLNNGVLTVRLPKAEAVKPRKIAVKGE
jgi:HSP20 family protein